MNKHTPKPWTVEYDNADERSGGQWFNVGPAKVWFSYSASDKEYAEAAANARLIAAAPEMYEALIQMVEHGDKTAFAKARAAIAKAEGA